MPSPEGSYRPESEMSGATGPDIVLPLRTSADRPQPVELNPDSFAAAKARQRAEAAAASGFGGAGEAVARDLDASNRARQAEQARQDVLAANSPNLITSVPGGRLTGEAAAAQAQYSEWAPRTAAQAAATEAARGAVAQAGEREDLDNTRERVRIKIPKWETGTQVAVRRSKKPDGSGGNVELDWKVDGMSPDGKQVKVTKPAGEGLQHEKVLGIYDLAATQPEFAPGTVVNAQIRGTQDSGWKVSSQESNGDVTITKGAEGSDRAHILHLPAAELAQWQQPQNPSSGVERSV